jgi:hypothetical protein
LDDVYSRVSGCALTGGSIMVIQTHGRNGRYNRVCSTIFGSSHLPI